MYEKLNPSARECPTITQCLVAAFFSILILVVIFVPLTLYWLDKSVYVVDDGQCPSDYDNHPVVVISMDGFRADFLQRGLTPTLLKISKTGVSTPFMMASYPTVTFSNHYAIATGMYPESHGIVANIMYDEKLNKSFRVGTEESKNRYWWTGEPIWYTIKRQGKISATYFWPGSEANEIHANYWESFDTEVPFEDRIKRIMEWLRLPKESRPDWISLYLRQPDHYAHLFGPNTTQVDEQLKHVDKTIAAFLEGIEKLGLTNCINLIVVADHGMATAGYDKFLDLADILPGITEEVRFIGGAFGRLESKFDDRNQTIEIANKLACKDKSMHVYLKEDLPFRMHYSQNDRIEDIVLDFPPGYMVQMNRTWTINGTHGYDNIYPLMHALFMATGPDFKENTTIPPFQNVELYNLFCHLTKVEPSPNNGTQGLLYQVLKNPPEIPKIIIKSPTFVKLLPIYAGDHDCVFNVKFNPESYEVLDSSEERIEENLESNMPFGYPSINHTNAIMILQQSYITESLNLSPVWSSIIVNKVYNHDPHSEIREKIKSNLECAHDSTEEVISLVPQNFVSTLDNHYLTALTSNSVAISKKFLPIWQRLLEIISIWVEQGSEIQFIAGPIYKENSTEVAGDIFVVLTKCRNKSIPLESCKDLVPLSFIFPQHVTIVNCLTTDEYIFKYIAKVKDVTIKSGIHFYTKLEPIERLKIITSLEPESWPYKN